MILSQLMRRRLLAIHWKIYVCCYMPRAWHENEYAVNGGQFAICMNVQTVVKNIPERGATRKQSHVVVVIQAIILVSSYCYHQWKLVALRTITSNRGNGPL